jgi:hypothetical protein
MRRSTRGRPASPSPAEETEQSKGSVLNVHFDKYIKADQQQTFTILKRLISDPNTDAAQGEKNFFPIKMRFSKLSKDEQDTLKQELGLPSTSTAAVSQRKISPPAAVSKKAKVPSSPKKSPSSAKGEDVEMTPEKEEVYDVYAALMKLMKAREQPIAIPALETREAVIITLGYEELSRALLDKVIHFCKIIKYIVFEYLFMKDTTQFDAIITDFANKLNTAFKSTPHAELLKLLEQRTKLKAIEASKFNELQTMIEAAKVSRSTKMQNKYMTAITTSLAEIQQNYPVLFKNYKEVVVKLQKEIGIRLTEPETETIALSLEDDLYKQAIVALATNSNKMLLYKYCSEFLEWAKKSEHKLKPVDYLILKSFNILTDLDKQVFESLFVSKRAKAISPVAMIRQTNKKSIIKILLEKQVRGQSARVSKRGISRLHGGDEELAM